MIFDKLCGIAERWMPQVEKILRQAKLFWWPGKPSDLPKENSEEQVHFLQENFFLPFRTMAVEDSVSCVVIQDTEEDQRGFGTKRRFIECMGVNDEVVLDGREVQGDPRSKEEMLKVVRDLRAKHGDFYVVVMGLATRRPDMDRITKGWFLDGAILGGYQSDGKNSFEALEGDTYKMCGESSMRNFGAALEEITLFNAPNRFVVEVTQGETRHKSSKIPRSHQRPQYTLLTKGEIKTIFRDPDSDTEDRASPSAHWRRRHYRTFHAEKFRAAKGKTIVVPACWVGPVEKMVGTKKYKVRIDL